MLLEHFVFISIAVLLLISELLGILSLRQNQSNLSTRLFYLIIAEAWTWLFFNLLELLAASESWTVIFMKLSFIPLMLLAPTLVWFGYAYIGEGQNRNIRYIYIPFVILMGFMLTNEFHHLFWVSYQFTQYGPLLSIRNTYGGLFYLFSLATYITIFFGAVVLLATLINIAKTYRSKAVVSIITLVLTIFWSVAYVMGIIPLHKDFSPVVYNFVFMVLIYAVIRQKLFDSFLVPRQKIFNHMRDGVIIFDERGKILDINQAAAQVIGSSEACIGNSLADELPFWQGLGFHIPTEHVEETELLPSTVVSIGESPDLCYFDVSISSIGLGYVLMLHDVTDRQRLMIQIEEMANFDSLTQLRNRRSFFNMVEGLIASAKRNRQPISIMLLDIDNFKQINDQYGHSTGDRVLVQLASHLSTSLRAVDVKARYGGDEFIILLPQTDITAAKFVANRLYVGIKDAIKEADIGIASVSVSIGISGRNVLGRTQSLMEVVEEADKALSIVKSKGKGFALTYFDLE
jgi:diguanylate cyclase (GGDEF)-like protein